MIPVGGLREYPVLTCSPGHQAVEGISRSVSLRRYLVGDRVNDRFLNERESIAERPRDERTPDAFLIRCPCKLQRVRKLGVAAQVVPRLFSITDEKIVFVPEWRQI